MMLYQPDRNALHSLLGGNTQDPIRLTLLSGSMAPALLPGDTLLIQALAGNRVHNGDVVVFMKERKVTAHRIIFVFRCRAISLLLEMGDANHKASLLDQKAVLGKVRALERQGLHIRLDWAAYTGRAARRTANRLRWRLLANRIPSGRLRKLLCP